MTPSVTKINSLSASKAVLSLIFFAVLSCSKPSPEPEPEEPAWNLDLKVALSRAKAEQKHVLFFASAPWCSPCERMKANVMTDPKVTSLLRPFELVYLNMDHPMNEDLWGRYGIKELPWIGFLDSNGQLLNREWVVHEELNVAQMAQRLELVGRSIADHP